MLLLKQLWRCCATLCGAVGCPGFTQKKDEMSKLLGLVLQLEDIVSDIDEAMPHCIAGGVGRCYFKTR